MPKKSFVPQVVCDLVIAYSLSFLIYGSLTALFTLGTLSLAKVFAWQLGWGAVAFFWFGTIYALTQLTKIGLVILDNALTVTLEEYKVDKP